MKFYSALLSIIMLLVLNSSGVWAASVEITKHNLSVTGPGDIKNSTTSNVCAFCHGRHNKFPRSARWKDFDLGTTYVPYASSTLTALPGQPTGASLLCLSCHDGTTARGNTLRGEDHVLSLPSMNRRPSLLGTDLSDDHPISFYYYNSYATNPDEYVHPDVLPSSIRLDATGQLQCTSCHDPHDDSLGMFLRMDNSEGQLCEACHQKFGWDDSVHSGLPLALGKPGTDSYSIRSGCNVCHDSHSAAGSQRLLQYRNEEDNCLVCHDGIASKWDMKQELSKPSQHNVKLYSGVHDPAEDLIINDRHVECVDCHNPHASGTNVSNNALSPTLNRVSGIEVNGAGIPANPGIVREYQLCFRCHGDSNDRGAPLVERLSNTTNVREEFSANSQSYHPVVVAGRNANAPSLITPLTPNSLIGCGDCHNNNDPQGPRGPHGSIYPGILAFPYLMQDNVVENPSSYALCYKCHDRNSILADQSFSSHALHISGKSDSSVPASSGTSCSTCHDAHASNRDSLINFDVLTVSPNSSGQLEFLSSGPEAGSCALLCHGKDHNPLCYDNQGTRDC